MASCFYRSFADGRVVALLGGIAGEGKIGNQA